MKQTCIQVQLIIHSHSIKQIEMMPETPDDEKVNWGELMELSIQLWMLLGELMES